jgi:ATP-dependent Zn protease
MRKKKELEQRARRQKYLEQQTGNKDNILMSEVGPITPAQLRINAVHEAGHAVVMTRIAHGCEVATVDPQEVKRLTGRAMPGYVKPVAKGINVETYLQTALAGVMSEAMHALNGRINPLEDDFSHAEQILDDAGIQNQQEREFYLNRARNQTRDLVQKYEAEIKTVADALVERLTLNGQEVRGLIGL